MMKITIQADSLDAFREATESRCDEVRFGAEFCEWKMPSLATLKEAYALAARNGKDFAYVTPRISDGSFESAEENLCFLSEQGSVRVVVNDFGVLHILGKYSGLKPQLGRQLVYMPSRCPWSQITEEDAGFVKRSRVEKVFYQTGLNYAPSVRLFKSLGVVGADVDWSPKSFPSFEALTRSGLNVSVHLLMVPVTVTGKCHMARYLGVKSLEKCWRPCNGKAFTLEHTGLGIQLVLSGNAVFKEAQLDEKGVKWLAKHKVRELVVTMEPATRIKGRDEIDCLVERLRC